MGLLSWLVISALVGLMVENITLYAARLSTLILEIIGALVGDYYISVYFNWGMLVSQHPCPLPLVFAAAVMLAGLARVIRH